MPYAYMSFICYLLMYICICYNLAFHILPYGPCSHKASGVYIATKNNLVFDLLNFTVYLKGRHLILVCNLNNHTILFLIFMLPKIPKSHSLISNKIRLGKLRPKYYLWPISHTRTRELSLPCCLGNTLMTRTMFGGVCIILNFTSNSIHMFISHTLGLTIVKQINLIILMSYYWRSFG